VHQVLLVEELERYGAEVVFLNRPMSRPTATDSTLSPNGPSDPAGVRLDEAEAVVPAPFTWFTNEGATIVALIKRLARSGITLPHKRYRTWNASAPHGILTNPTYSAE
jgi:hypothetical protein